MDSLADFIDEERDVLYVRGQRKTKQKIVTNLLIKINLTVEQIADVVEVSTEFVLKVKHELSKESK